MNNPSGLQGMSEKDLIAIQRRLGLEGSLVDFIRMAWPLVENTEYIHNWHIDVICEHLEATLKGDIKRLCVNIPPSFMKSLITCVFFPVFAWIRNPKLRFICTSFDGKLTARDAKRSLNIITSSWFKARWGDIFMVAKDSPVGDYNNNKGGRRYSSSVEGKTTGNHADYIIVDDPLKPQSMTDAGLENVITWWRETMPTRLRDQKTGRKVIIMQRLHEGDLTGYVLQHEKDENWQSVCMPMRAEELKGHTKLWTDKRAEGELLWPERMAESEVKALETTLGSMAASAQLQQRPAPASGAVFKKEWMKYYDVLPAKFDKVIQTWDMTFKDSDGSDFVAGQVWGQVGANFYLIFRIHKRMDFPATLEAVKKTTKAYPRARAKLVEDKANGPAVISMLKSTIAGLIAVNPEGGKLARANAVAPLFEAGNVHLPDPLLHPWVTEYVNNMCSFPVAVHDDDVDATSQGLNYLHDKNSMFKEAMEKAGEFGRALAAKVR